MWRLIVILLSVIILSGCYDFLYGVPAARQERAHAELRAALEEIQAAYRRGQYPNWAEVFRDYGRRVEAIYARHGLQVDPFDRVYVSYAIALAARLDRGEISSEDVGYLLSRMEADIALERARLNALYQAYTPRYYQGWNDWWGNYWSITQEEIWRRAFRNPVRCSVRSYGGGISYADCY